MSAQLSMFPSTQERDLAAENGWLQQRLEHAIEEFRKLRTERDTWRNGHNAVKTSWERVCQERDALQRRVSGLESVCDVYKMLLDAGARRVPLGAPPISRDDLTRLLTIAHPDKWSQGQPATQLAHELSVALNALRERSEVPA